MPRPALNTLVAVLLLVPLGNAYAGRAQDELASRLGKLESALDNRGLLDLLQQVEQLQQEVQRLRGQLENQNYLIEQLRKTQRETYVNVDERLRAMEQTPPIAGGPGTAPAGIDEPPLATLDAASGGAVAGLPAPDSGLEVEVRSSVPQPAVPRVAGTPTSLPGPEGGDARIAVPVVVQPGATVSSIAPAGPTVAPIVMPPVTAATPLTPRAPTVDTEDSEVAYRDAFDLLKAGQYDESIAAFKTFLAAYPNSQYADNSQYWLGEAYYVMRQFELAVAEYRKLIDAYAESSKRSHALLKIGYSYDEMGQPDQARAMLEELRANYPGTTAARLADERIERIHGAANP